MTTVLAEDVISQLKEWRAQSEKANKPLKYFAGVDIGGTNTRVALSRHDGSHNADGEPYLLVSKFAVNTVKGLLEGLKHVGSQIKQILGVSPVSTSLDAAGPVQEQGNKVTVTNYQQDDATLRKKDLPTELFPPNSTTFLNDLASTCFGINALHEEGTIKEYFGTLWGDEAPNLKMEHYLVMAMGTGLGCALLMWTGKKFEVLPLEFGHTQLTVLGSAHPQHTEERALAEYIGAKIYDNKHLIEWEDICSGRGLVSCYEFFSKTKNTPDAAQISQKAQSATPDPDCVKALLTHYRYLFRAGQLQCVGLQAKGVFLAGDNQVHNTKFVSDPAHVQTFKADFLNHPKSHLWLTDIPVFQQTKIYNLNLHGCLHVAYRQTDSA